MTYFPGGGATFITLPDTPGAYAGAAGLVAIVNPGEDAMEFAAGGGGGGGGGPLVVGERRAEAVQAIIPGGTFFVLDFEVAGINDHGGDLTWDGGASAWENTSGGPLEVNIVVTIACQDSGATGRPAFNLQLDTGGGFAVIVGTEFWSEQGRMSSAKVHRINLAAGDKIAVFGRAIAGTVNLISASVFQVFAAGGTPAAAPADYSTTEADTGQLWHNGKNIFKKTLTGIVGAAAGVQTDTAHGITTIEEMIAIEEFGDNGTTFFPGTRNFNGARSGSFVDATNYSRRADLSTEVGFTFAVTLYYTKV